MSTKPEDRKLATHLGHVAPLDSMKLKANPRHAALLIVDVQNDFCAPGGVLATEGRDIGEAMRVADRLPSLIEEARAAGVLVVFIRTVYTTSHNFYLSDSYLEQAARRSPQRHTSLPVCGADSWGGDYYGDVKPRPEDPVVTKHRYSAFFNTDLDTILRAHEIRTLIMTGIATNVCVATTAHDGFMRDYYIVLLNDGTASYRKSEHEMALEDIDRYFGEVSNMAEIVSIWKEYSAQQSSEKKSKRA